MLVGCVVFHTLCMKLSTLVSSNYVEARQQHALKHTIKTIKTTNTHTHTHLYTVYMYIHTYVDIVTSISSSFLLSTYIML